MAFFTTQRLKMMAKKKVFSRIHIDMYFLQKTEFKMVKFGLCGPIYILQTPIGVPTLYPVSAPRQQRDRVQQCTRYRAARAAKKGSASTLRLIQGEHEEHGGVCPKNILECAIVHVHCIHRAVCQNIADCCLLQETVTRVNGDSVVVPCALVPSLDLASM